MEVKFAIERSFMTSAYIWAGKRLDALRADGAQREPILPFVVGDMIAAMLFGCDFVGEDFGFKFEGLSVQGVTYENDQIDLLRECVKSDILIAVVKTEEGEIADRYELRGWITRRECFLNGSPSKTFGAAGVRIELDQLRPMDEMLPAIRNGVIPIEIEEIEDPWWDK